MQPQQLNSTQSKQSRQLMHDQCIWKAINQASYWKEYPFESIKAYNMYIVNDEEFQQWSKEEMQDNGKNKQQHLTNSCSNKLGIEGNSKNRIWMHTQTHAHNCLVWN